MQFDNPLHKEAHAKQLELVVICNLIPPVIDKPPRLIYAFGIYTADTILGLLPGARRRCLSLWRQLRILWHWLIIVVDCDASLA
jgi:hypothetical protein